MSIETHETVQPAVRPIGHRQSQVRMRRANASKDTDDELLELGDSERRSSDSVGRAVWVSHLRLQLTVSRLAHVSVRVQVAKAIPESCDEAPGRTGQQRPGFAFENC